MSGALSALDSEKLAYVTGQIYERVETVCQNMGLKCYLPHKSQTTPTKGMPHGKVWQIDYQRVVNSGAVVAYIGIPSSGVGAEIEMARTANVPVILLFENKSQEQLSRLILGNPIIKYVINFDRTEEINEQLKNNLFMIFSEKNLDAEASEKNWSFRKREALRKQLSSVEKSMQDGMAFRNLDAPVSQEKWSEFGQDWDKKNNNKNGLLDDFFKS
jgi:2'-deoxynucleoside 5'-phosphate N-hydrolase